MELREPKDVEIKCQDGSSRTYTISKVPAMVGFKLVTQYPILATPKIGNWNEFESLYTEIFKYVEAYAPDGSKILLVTKALIDNHVPDWEALARIQKEMAQYNISFFQNGKPSSFLEGFMQMVNSRITPMLTDLLRSLSEKNTQPSEN
jgi:hypothetical protein